MTLFLDAVAEYARKGATREGVEVGTISEGVKCNRHLIFKWYACEKQICSS